MIAAVLVICYSYENGTEADSLDVDPFKRKFLTMCSKKKLLFFISLEYYHIIVYFILVSLFRATEHLKHFTWAS